MGHAARAYDTFNAVKLHTLSDRRWGRHAEDLSLDISLDPSLVTYYVMYLVDQTAGSAITG